MTGNKTFADASTETECLFNHLGDMMICTAPPEYYVVRADHPELPACANYARKVRGSDEDATVTSFDHLRWLSTQDANTKEVAR